MPRVLMLYTGGTIGMQPSPQGYVPCAGLAERLAAHLALGDSGRLPVFDVVEMQPLIDSAELMPEAWNRLVAQLESHWQRYDAFVVLHGTDTMACSAAALSFMLGALNKPVIFTGSQIPLGEPRSDALNNVVSALQLAAHPDTPREVCLAFHDRLLRGNRARKVRTQGLDAFDSPNFPWLGELGIGITLNVDSALATGTPNFAPIDLDPEAVALLPLHPGMSLRRAKALLADDSLKGLVLYSYGVGNPPSFEGELLSALTAANERGVALLNVTQCAQGDVVQGAYATGAALNRAGVVAGADITPEAAVAKLTVLLGRGISGLELRQALKNALRGECSSH
ncbi:MULTISPECIES: asparaginase domain-containing protein [unclassified Halomonas]|uniref:asparaginase domain-containing protein n=1 Tax=unclassified Halomonas TaxID=2609666 RepID=UPI0009907429|nr:MULTISPECIES: asparaginase domain-containing protein [unclassified Halomonas]AQU81268.1 L-asparaginase 1 [Halomonas sp. 'Soap Lake \